MSAPKSSPKKAKAAPKDKDKKESSAECWQILSALRRPFAERDQKWPVRRRVRMREEDVPVPEAYTGTALKHRSSEPDYMVRQIVALLAENKEQYIIYPPVETDEMRRFADETQKAIAAVMEMLEDQHPIERPRYLIHDYQVADGLGIEKISFNWEFFSKVIDTKGDTEDWSTAFEKYVKENRELPIRKSVIDPLECYWEFDVNGLVAVAEYGKARRSALRDTYGEDVHIMNSLARIPISDNSGSSNISNSTGGYSYNDEGDTVTIIELWTRKEFFLMAEGEKDRRELLIRQPHPFKRPPYFFSPGILTGHKNPLHTFQPLILPMYPLALELSAVRTARLNAAFLSSFKPFYVQFDDGNSEMDEESGGIKVRFLAPGNEIPSIKGGKIVPINWTDLDELEKIENSLMGDRDRFGFQAILAGTSPASGESTAWATRMLRDQGMIQFNGVLNHFAQSREEQIRFILDIVQHVIKDDVPITRKEINTETKRPSLKTVKLTTKMAETNFGIQVSLTAGRAADRIAIVEEYRRGHEMREVPMREVLEKGWGYTNATEIMNEVVDEDIQRELMPDTMKLAFQVAMKGALEDLVKVLPLEAPPSPQQVQQQVDEQAAMEQEQAAQEQAMMQQQAAMAQPPPAPSGEIPLGVQEPGLGGGLVPPELPLEEAALMPLQ